MLRTGLLETRSFSGSVCELKMSSCAENYALGLNSKALHPLGACLCPLVPCEAPYLWLLSAPRRAQACSAPDSHSFVHSTQIPLIAFRTSGEARSSRLKLRSNGKGFFSSPLTLGTWNTNNDNFLELKGFFPPLLHLEHEIQMMATSWNCPQSEHCLRLSKNCYYQF